MGIAPGEKGCQPVAIEVNRRLGEALRPHIQQERFISRFDCGRLALVQKKNPCTLWNYPQSTRVWIVRQEGFEPPTPGSEDQCLAYRTPPPVICGKVEFFMPQTSAVLGLILAIKNHRRLPMGA